MTEEGKKINPVAKNLLESIETNQKALEQQRKALYSPILEAIQKDTERLNNLFWTQSFRSLIENISRPYSILSVNNFVALNNLAMFDSIQRVINSSLLPIQRLQEQMNLFNSIQFNIFDNILKDPVTKEYLDEFGWIEAFGYGYHWFLSSNYSKEKSRVWAILLEDLKDEELTSKQLNKLTANPVFSPRMRIIKRAVEAHKGGDYVISIPLLLMQIEGVLWDYGVKKKIIEDAYNSKKRIDQNGSVILRSDGKPNEATIQFLLSQLCHGGSNFQNHMNEKVYSTDFRHPVLHGRLLNYDEEERSALLLLTLYSLEKLMASDFEIVSKSVSITTNSGS